MKDLKEILYKAGIVEIYGSTDMTIGGICFDSRKATEGSVVVATRGAQADGHQFIDAAIEKGSAAIVCEDLPKQKKAGVTYVRVSDGSEALSIMASNFFDNPSEKIKLVGVTGTNGKTTTSTLLFQLFRALGYGTGLLSTVKNQINDQIFPATHTTPD